MKNARIPLWLVASLLLAAATSLFSIAQRHKVEARNKAVALSAEYETIEGLAQAQGLTVTEALKRLKDAGLNSIVLTEQTVGDLESAGHAQIHWSEQRSGPGETGELDVDPSNRSRVARGLAIRFGSARFAQGAPTIGEVAGSPSPNLVRSTSVGLNPNEVDLSHEANLEIVGRFANPAGLSASGVQQTLAWAQEEGVSIYLPLGDQVLGRRDALGTTIESLRQLGILYATPEFTKIGGDANVVSDAPDLVVRLHSAQTAELDKMPLADCVERYGKAARERNMRVLLLRPVSYSAPAPLDDFADFVKQVDTMVTRQGGVIGVPHAFTGPDLPRWWPVLVALTFMPVVWFAAAVFVTDRRWQAAGAIVLCLAALAAYTKSGAQVDAFLASLAFPFLGYVLFDHFRPKNVVVAFALISVVSLIGGFCVAGMLNGLSYYIQADEFRGVKLSIFLPVLIVGWYFFSRLLPWKQTMKSPILWGTAALGIVLLVVLAVVIQRTGNDSAVGVSDSELLFRNFLDRFLYVRPRTKEIFIGHPLLVIGCGLLIAQWKGEANSNGENRVPGLPGWIALTLMVSSIGQTDIVNTLSHIHIPVMLSIVRALEGMAIGCIIGVVAWVLIERYGLRKVN